MTDVLNIPKLPDEDDTEGLRAHLRNGISAILQNSQVQLQPDVVSNQKDSPVHIDVANQVNPFAVHEPLYDLIKLLAEHVQLVLKRLQSQDDSLLLEAYLTEWDQYVTAANRIDRLLNLINRHWVQREIDEGKPDVYHIRTLHFVQWRSYLWATISVAVIDSAQLVMEKSNENGAKIRDVLKGFASLQIDDSALTGDTRTRIQESLEAPFLSEIEAHERSRQNIIAARLR
ncbi:ubiquitin ligase (cullin) of SCF [Fusarium irregulare]|uniref:Ubiquitin ligase (Cullin) of SCF n=1 Tax=Fusarium irregulare TaxID=2494466 RepID=A0A9W8PI29_9HYPO|nr:ubiquitin ligase (cullin) of SCF [Fusarium irregulare]